MKAHWSPRYMVDRCLAEVWATTVYRHRPWINRHAVRRLHTALAADGSGWHIVEFGSGRSSVYLASMGASLISFETEATWAATVTEWLSEGSSDCTTVVHWDVFDLELLEGALRSSETPDLIFVDGGDRLAAVRWALKELRPGGLLVVDNANRFWPSGSRSPGSVKVAAEEWSELWRELDGWDTLWESDGVNDTFFALRPA